MPAKNGQSLREKTVVGLFALTDFIDKARWQKTATESLINYAPVELSDDEKILVHWLCYITDRQTAWERIWDVGGFILSQLVHDIKRKKSLSILNPASQESYFKSAKEYPGYKLKEKGYLFRSKIPAGHNQTLKEYGFATDEHPFFISRYYPADYKAILNTLKVLEGHGFSLTRYVKSVLETNVLDLSLKHSIRKLLFALYLLSYHNIGQPKADNIDFEKFSSEAASRATEIESMLSNQERFSIEFKSFLEYDIYNQKRAWCALRDYLKYSEFNKSFLNALNAAGYKETTKLQSKELLKQLELPGDVWNNNPKFRNCMLKGTGYEKSEESLNLLLRQIYEESKPAVGYPEQFDISFDLVQRMCKQDECEICPYGTLNGKAIDFHKVCIRKHSYFCPVILVSCGYKVECEPEKCTIIQMAEKKPGNEPYTGLGMNHAKH
jgi:hypothetical protein